MIHISMTYPTILLKKWGKREALGKNYYIFELAARRVASR